VAQAGDAKFADSGVHHRPSRGCEAGETRESIDGIAEEQRSVAKRRSVPRHRRRDETSWRYDVRTVGGARGQRRIGVTRGFSLAKPEGGRIRGNSGDSSAGAGRCSAGETRSLVVGDTEAPQYGETRRRHSAAPKDSTLESPRGASAGKAGRCGRRGNPRPASKARQAMKSRGNSELQSRQRRRMRDSSRLENSIAGNSRRTGFRGNSRLRSPTRPMDAAYGETRRSITGWAGRCGSRGYPELAQRD